MSESNIHPTAKIHPTAIIEPGAKIGANTVVEGYSIIKSGVTIKKNVVVRSHVYIDGNVTIDEETQIWPFVSIGTKTQHRRFRGEETYVEIGKRCEIREYVTINSSCGDRSVVRVGDDCLIMAYGHVAHNCELEEGVILTNNATLGGHVHVGKSAILGGMVAVHQFVRIGSYSMVGGMSRVTHDIPPFTIGAGANPYKFGGLNLVGLKRNGFPRETRSELSKAFRLLYRSGLCVGEALERIEKEVKPIAEVQHFLDFCRNSKRGLLGVQGITRAVDEMEYEEALSECS